MITILFSNPDGRVIGADEAGRLHVGTPVDIPGPTLEVTTEIAADGNSFYRVSKYPSGEIHSHGTATCDAFEAQHRLRLPDDTDEQVAAAWEAEKTIAAHTNVGNPQGEPYTHYEWQAI